MKCKLKSHKILEVVLAVILILLIYQVFFVLPERIERLEGKTELFVCSSNPITMIVEAIKEAINSIEQGTKVCTDTSEFGGPGVVCHGTGLKSVFCLHEREVLHKCNRE